MVKSLILILVLVFAVANNVVATRGVVAYRSREIQFKRSAEGGSTYNHHHIIGTWKARSRLECAKVCTMSNVIEKEPVCQTFDFTTHSKLCTLFNVKQQASNNNHMFYLNTFHGYHSYVTYDVM